MTTTTTAPPLTVDHGRELAGDLIRELAPLSGNGEAVNEVLTRWLDVLDAVPLALVCIAAVQSVFSDCLVPTPLDDLPPDRLALLPPNREENP